MSLEIAEELIARQAPEAQAIIRLLLGKIAELEARLWTFLDVEGVEPTNNASERALPSVPI